MAWFRRLWKKDYFSLLTFVTLGIYIPQFFYFAGWSGLFLTPIQDDFYWMFIMMNICILVAQLFDPIIEHPSGFSLVSRMRPATLLFIDAVYLASLLAENYLGSGLFLPALSGIDIHTYHAPGLFYITGSLFVVLALNTLYALSRNRWFLLADVVVLGVLVIGKAARQDAFVAIGGVLVLILYLGIGQDVAVIRRRIREAMLARRFLTGVVASLVVVLVIWVGVNVGDARMNQYGKYDLEYASGIDYLGPDPLGGGLSMYYGYFPFSFYNLNNNMAYTDPAGSYIGLNSFRSLYFGILQFDLFFGDPLNYANMSKIVVTKAATIPTGFWDFFFDYDSLCIIPMGISVAGYLFLRRKLYSSRSSVSSVLMYFYWTPLWFFMSFNNSIWDTCVLINLVILAYAANRCFELVPKREEKEEIFPKMGES